MELKFSIYFSIYLFFVFIECIRMSISRTMHNNCTKLQSTYYYNGISFINIVNFFSDAIILYNKYFKLDSYFYQRIGDWNVLFLLWWCLKVHKTCNLAEFDDMDIQKVTNGMIFQFRDMILFFLSIDYHSDFFNLQEKT